MHLLDCVCVFDCFGNDSLHVFDRTWVGVYLCVCVCVCVTVRLCAHLCATSLKAWFLER